MIRMTKTEEFTELELFRMALRMTEISISNTANTMTVMNREDLIFDRIMECHSAIRRAADECLGKGQQAEH